jgi:RNA polymerase sigma-70 factor (ECF subfamily)
VRLASDEVTEPAAAGEHREPSGRDEAFQRLVVPEIETMLGIARGLTRGIADAEDLAQDALVRAYRAIDPFDGRHPRAWLLTIVRNTHINRGRRRLRDQLVVTGYVGKVHR